MTTESYALFSVRFAPSHSVPEQQVLEFVQQHGFRAANVTHGYRHGEGLEYQMVVHSLDDSAVSRLSEALRQRTDVAEYRISPTGD